ncbi:MAG: hypothetical protein VX278_10255 [Myxococcota bacterium]|nr:hypothetical protein [Myxococcota bacterium]
MVNLLFLLACTPTIAIDIPPPPPLQGSTERIDTRQRYHVLRAWHASHQNRWDIAQIHFQKAVQYAPSDPWIYVHWGDAAKMLNQESDAVNAWSKALSLFGVKQTQERTLIHQRLRSYP